MTYEVIAARWHDFYLLAGTSAATLVGLLFVGLSLHLRAVLAHPEVRLLARITLANFGVILVLSLFLVIAQGPAAAGTELIFSGIVSVLIVVPSVLRAVRSRSVLPHPVQRVVRVTFSVSAYAAIAVAGVLIRRAAYSTAFIWLVVATILLIVVSLRNSWDLLVLVAEIPTETHRQADG
jgi:hypothetical protein